MSENQEDIIIIEDSDAAEALQLEKEELQELHELEKQKKIKRITFSVIGSFLLLIIIITFTLLIKNEPTVTIDMEGIDEKLLVTPIEHVEPSALENMIAKANYLYTSGSKTDALALYEKIAHYSEAISEYNLGVAQLKEKQYKQALNTFAKAIKNDEKRCVSAINAAVCALHLEDKESFRYYLDLAYAYLPSELNSPLYSYYYTLINYYKKNYIAALNSLKNGDASEYPYVQKNLSAKINALYDNNYDAIEVMEKYFEEDDDMSIAMLYARIGDYALAINHLNESIVKNIAPVRSQLALGLINLKVGNMKEAAKQIDNVTDMFPDNVYTHYPLRVKLKESLFDPEKAQEVYKNEITNSKSNTYQKIFYFSPYKIFNANQTISYIRKGNANIYIDNIKTAQQLLKKSSASSSVNIGITKAIQKALQLHVREANTELQKLVKIQPKHSILQYNLALTYAQLGDISKAHEHFLRSYYLDAKNYISGIYAVMTAQLIDKDIHKVQTIINEALLHEDINEEIDLYRTLMYISQNDYLSAVDWLDNRYTERPLYLALNVLIGLKVGKESVSKDAATKLTTLMPNDILPHILYIDANFTNLPTLKYAAKVLSYLDEQTFNFNDLYYGPYITRHLYIQLSLLTGKLYYLREQLKSALASFSTNTQEIQSALAMASLFDKHFEESYTLYNHLIDELKVQDAYTLFLGAVASTAAEHHANAIALLELSKMKNKTFYESRYALALLYMESENNDGAVIQLSKIHSDSFHSRYFDFEIDTEKLLRKSKNLN